MEDTIRLYFEAWLKNDLDVIKRVFAENIVYTECYGPEYRGISQIVKWFVEWNKRGKVLEWTIKRVIQQNRTLVVEWFFKNEYDGAVDEFDGVSIVDFDDDMKILKLCEFQSQSEHCYPYGK